MYYKSLKTLENGVTMILKNLEDVVLDNQWLDENKAKFCTAMGYKLTDNMLSKSCTNEKKLCCKNESKKSMIKNIQN